MIAFTRWAITGISSSMARKFRSCMTTSVTSEVAATVAVRGTFSSNAISPKKSPGPRSARCVPSWVTSAVPDSITMNSWGYAPWFTRCLFVGTSISSVHRSRRSYWWSVTLEQGDLPQPFGLHRGIPPFLALRAESSHRPARSCLLDSPRRRAGADERDRLESG